MAAVEGILAAADAAQVRRGDSDYPQCVRRCRKFDSSGFDGSVLGGSPRPPMRPT
jgi:hypothetical protein